MSNLKVNDLVICINNENTNLLLNHIYKIFIITTDSDPRIHQDYMELVTLKENINHGYYSHRFVKLKDLRKDKLTQLNK